MTTNSVLITRRLLTVRYVQAGVFLIGSAAYLGVAMSWMSPSSSSILVASVVWYALLFVVAVLVTIDGVRKVRAGKTQALGTDVIVVKLAAVPFFLINFLVLTTVAFFGSVLAALGARLPDLGGYMFAAAGIAIGLTYLAMLTTSPYGWAAIARLRRDGTIGRPLAMLYGVLLFMFVADVVVGILLYVHSRRAQAAIPQSPTEAVARNP